MQMFKAFKKAVYDSQIHYDETGGFTTIDNSIFTGVFLNGVIAIASFCDIMTDNACLFRFSPVCLVLAAVFYLFFGLYCWGSDVKISHNCKTLTYDNMVKYHNDDLSIVSFYAFVAMALSPWTYVIWAWRLLVFVITAVFGGIFYKLPKFVFYSLPKSLISGKPAKYNIVSEYNDLLGKR